MNRDVGSKVSQKRWLDVLVLLASVREWRVLDQRECCSRFKNDVTHLGGTVEETSNGRREGSRRQTGTFALVRNRQNMRELLGAQQLHAGSNKASRSKTRMMQSRQKEEEQKTIAYSDLA